MNHLQFRVAAGTIAMTWSSQGLLSRLDWYNNGPLRPDEVHPCPSSSELPSSLHELLVKLRVYFSTGESIGEIPWDLLDTRGWSEFQARVYRALLSIPHGETRTYAWAAARIGKIEASRAVGQALRHNPLPILIPCHRIVAAKTLGGFMGTTDPDQPELKFKKWLLELENSYLNPYFSFIA